MTFHHPNISCLVNKKEHIYRCFIPADQVHLIFSQRTSLTSTPPTEAQQGSTGRRRESNGRQQSQRQLSALQLLGTHMKTKLHICYEQSWGMGAGTVGHALSIVVQYL